MPQPRVTLRRTEMGAVVLDGGAEVAEVLGNRLRLVREHARRLEVHAVHVAAESLQKLMHDGATGACGEERERGEEDVLLRFGVSDRGRLDVQQGVPLTVSRQTVNLRARTSSGLM